jgi:hypothetical protein
MADHETPADDPAYNPARPETRKTPVDNPPSGRKADEEIKVTYNPLPGDPDETDAFGRKFKAGEAVKLPARFADKVRGNPSFSVAGEKTHGDERREADEPEEQEPATFEENLARERSAEYLEGQHRYTTAAPGDAERVARAQEQARELQSAVEDEPDKPRRGPGRPPKAR